MAEWHVTPDYIMNNWTDELLDLMIEKLIERTNRETSAIKTPEKPVESEELFKARTSNLIRWETKHGD